MMYVKVKNALFLLPILICCTILLLLITPAHALETLPLIPETSSYIDQIDTENFPFTLPPEKQQLVRWDFSGTKVYPYDFSQTTAVMNQMSDMFTNGSGKIHRQTMNGKGNLSLKSEQNNSARFVLENLTIDLEFKRADSDDTENRQMQAPPMVVQGMKEDGSMEMGNSSQELLFKTLFPIPPTPLKIGESAIVPANMPFNAMGSLLHVTGFSEIKLVEYVEISGKTCAKLETDIDISELNVPAEMKGEYICQMKGKSVFYFNVEDRHFISGKVALLMSMRVVAPTPKMNFPKSQTREKQPEKIKMAMDSDNLLSVIYTGN